MFWVMGGCSGVDAFVVDKVWVFWSVRVCSWGGFWCSGDGDGVGV